MRSRLRGQETTPERAPRIRPEHSDPPSPSLLALARSGAAPDALVRAAGPELQRLASNALLQRAPLAALEVAKNLKAARYAGDPVLEAAYDNKPALKRGKKDDAVAKVQQGLIDDGYEMPGSVKAGKPDGIFGKETVAIVKEFQRHYGLEDDGRVGRGTMGKLDELAAGTGPTPTPPSPTPEIAATEEEMGKRVAEGMQRANTGHSPTSGIWYDYNYFAEHKKDPATYPWKDDWRSGLASLEYFDHIGWMDWRLRPRKSASEGIKAWIKGLTIAECLSSIVAIETDTLRAAIGDAAFDAKFGSTDKVVPEAERLRVRAGTKGTAIEGKTKQSEAATGDPGSIGKRPLKVGDWVYFYNHPKYLLKHPGGAWQGENAVYVGNNPAGEQLFSGQGAVEKTEDRMIQEDMVDAYNSERDGADYADLLSTYAANTPEVRKPSRKFLDHDTEHTRSLYVKYKHKIPAMYHEDSGEFDDTTTTDKILGDPAYTLHGTTRKGGFLARVATRLDPGEVGKLRPTS